MRCEQPGVTNGPVWTVSNILSLLRIALTGPIILALLQNSTGGNITAGILVAAAAATDFFDGMLARRLGEVSEFGKIVDPLADKIAVASVALALALLGRIPFWFFILAVSRDLLILSGGIRVRIATGVTLQSVPAGKWAVAVTAAALFRAIVAPDAPAAVASGLLAGSTLLLAASFAVYARRFSVVMREHRLEPDGISR
jgi:CDP-diacylglycerol--glycerol-3-phosphate 3-phosphatidyltransferase